MKALLSLSRLIDTATEHIGRIVYWLVLAAVLISAAIVNQFRDVADLRFEQT